jgi:hypothetical protein
LIHKGFSGCFLLDEFGHPCQQKQEQFQSSDSLPKTSSLGQASLCIADIFCALGKKENGLI